MRIVPPKWTPEEYRDRPKDYDPAVADRILERLENGELLPSICSNDRDMPLPGTFLKWVYADPHLERLYVQARQIGTEVSVDEAVVAAQNRNAPVAGNESRAIMWHAERTWPEKYGPRAFVKTKEGEGQDGGVDYTSEVRRKIDDMARKIQANAVSSGQDPQAL